MKNSILSLIIFFSLPLLKAQQYMENSPVDSTLRTSGHMFTGNCTGNQVHIELDTSLYNYVSELQFIIIIDSIHFPGPMGVLPIHPGDTIALDSASPSFTVNISNLDFWYRIKLIGTPTIEGQTYPCAIDIIQCLCFCTNISIRASQANTSICTVDMSNNIPELKNTASISIFPNPVVNKLSVSGITEKTTIRLFDSMGKLVMEKETSSDLDYNTAHLANGMYTLYIICGNKKVNSTKVMIQHK